jgi:hypothetical protein
MPEGLSPEEVGKEIAEHTKAGGDQKAVERRDQLLSITEAVLLSIVALLAAWSGYSAAKWSTESRVGLAKASAARTEASRATLQGHQPPQFRLLDLRGVVLGLHRPQQASDGPRGAPLPSRIRCRV